MAWFGIIGQFFKVVLFFLDLWKEKDKKKAEEKAEIAKEIVDAFKQTDKAQRASSLNIVVGKLRR